MPGTRIGVIVEGPEQKEFELTDFLGAGVYGEVYRAEEKDSGSLAAVKLLPLMGSSDPSLKLSLLNEAQLATQVSHPNVVNVLQVGDHPDVGPYVLMEYVPGQTLEQFLHARIKANSAIPLGRAVEIMLHIAQGARAINEKLVHRDIKPDNILVSGDQLKITDFGISKLVAERTRTMTFKGAGPVRYMAPEAWQLQQNTPMMDVYSVGLVFYEILTLKHPLINFVADPTHIEAWRRAHLFEAPQDIRSNRDDAPRPLAQLLLRMTGKRPADRPSWDEVISVLSSSGENGEESEDLSQIVDKAIERREKVEKARLAEEQRRSAEQDVERLYEVAFEQLVARWDAIMESFNTEYQGNRITKRQRSPRSFEYVLPNAPTIRVNLFSRRETNFQIRGGTLIGGGLVAIDQGASANLLLLKDSRDDLYGRWTSCQIKLYPTVVPQSALSHLTRKPPLEPFGLQNETDFYEHIRWAGRGARHIFSYEFRDDLEGLYNDLLYTAFSK